MALPNNITADWCRRDTREKVLALPRGLSAPPQLIAGANAPQWEYPILPRRVGPHLPPSVLGEPRTVAPNSQARDFHAKAQPGNGIILNFEKKDTLVNPFNPLSGLCDGPRLPEAISATRAQLVLQIQAAANTFNAAVTRYNQAIAQFPAVLLAWVFGFKPGRPL